MVRRIKNILKVLYDIKPVKNGDVDLEKINSIKEKIDLRNYIFGKQAILIKEEEIKEIPVLAPRKPRKPIRFPKVLNLFKLQYFKNVIRPIAISLVLIILAGSAFFAFKGLFLQQKQKESYFQALLVENFKSFLPVIEENAKDLNKNVKNADFKASKRNLENIYQEISKLSEDIPAFGKFLVSLPFVNKYYPFFDLIARAKIILKTTISSLDAIDNVYNKYLFGGILGDPEYHQKTLENLAILEKNNKIIFSNLAALNTDLSKVSKSPLGDLFDEQMETFKDKYLVIQNYIIEANKYIKEFKVLLGVNESRNYFVILQNESEIRPAGGFIGSLAKVSLVDGKLRSLDFFDIYDIDGQIKKKYIPPHQLWNIASVWKTRDANWFFDFEKSAKKIAFFLNSSAFFPKTKIDGVVAINTKIFSDILEITGPIELEKYGQLTSKNFLGVLQYNTELGPDSRSKHPKNILKVLLPEVFEKLTKINDQQKKQLFEKILFRLQNKDIQIYFANPLLEQEAKKFDVAGIVLNQPESSDYLAIVNTNIAGGKTDIFINQKVSLKSEVQEDGSIIDTLTVERKHFGKKAKYSFWRKTNKDYMQIFVPENSQIIEAAGFREKVIVPLADYSLPEYLIDDDLNEIELGTIKDTKNKLEIFKESKKTVFGGWVYTYPGKTSKITIKYKLPFKIDLTSKQPLRLLYQKQSSASSTISWEAVLPEGFIFRGSKSSKISQNQEKILNYKLFKTPEIIPLISF